MAFALNAANETTVVLNSAEWDGDSICMSMTSLIGGLTMLIGKSIFSYLDRLDFFFMAINI